MTILDDLSAADMATPQQRTVLCKRAHDEIVRLREALLEIAEDKPTRRECYGSFRRHYIAVNAIAVKPQ